jgi:DNA-binding winged helix-turn-helix (wHTH) protein
MAGSFVFEQFVLDPDDRQLKRGGDPIELNGRYFDALALLIREQGKLVSKDRFLDEVWRGVPVTDEALTQCVKTLRRQLGDDAARPRFIETVPKHGYRFIAPVNMLEGRTPAAAARPYRRHQLRAIGLAGIVGGAVAGVIGGLIYGFAGASVGQGAGALSVLLVLLSITTVVATVGAAGVSFAIAAFVPTRSWQRLILAGAGGGLVTGAIVKLLGIDTFTLLIGRAPHNITGAMEGLLVGAAVGVGSWLAQRLPLKRQAAFAGASIGALAGVAAVLLGGHLLLGSLATLTRDFPDSHLNIARFGGLFGETQFGPTTELVTAALEAALFVGSVVAMIEIAWRRLNGARD